MRETLDRVVPRMAATSSWERSSTKYSRAALARSAGSLGEGMVTSVMK
jgi:hypothetical protein